LLDGGSLSWFGDELVDFTTETFGRRVESVLIRVADEVWDEVGELRVSIEQGQQDVFETELDRIVVRNGSTKAGDGVDERTEETNDTLDVRKRTFIPFVATFFAGLFVTKFVSVEAMFDESFEEFGIVSFVREDEVDTLRRGGVMTFVPVESFTEFEEVGMFFGFVLGNIESLFAQDGLVGLFEGVVE
jgi:hypothetical protein